MAGAFQADAFQNDAFQVEEAVAAPTNVKLWEFYRKKRDAENYRAPETDDEVATLSEAVAGETIPEVAGRTQEQQRADALARREIARQVAEAEYERIALAQRVAEQARVAAEVERQRLIQLQLDEEAALALMFWLMQ